MPYLVTPDKTPLYYHEKGNVKTPGIIFIHGEPFNTKFWAKNIDELSKEFRIVSLDVRGRGESGKTDNGQTLEQMGKDLRFVMESLDLKKSVVVGWSMGAAIVWSYIQQFGELDIAGFVDVDQRPYRFKSYNELESRLASLGESRLERHRNTIEEYFGPELRGTSDTIDWMAYECMKTPTSIHRAAVIESYMADYRLTLPMINVPSLIFWARYGVINSEWAKFLNNNIRNSRLVYFEHSGHMLPWTEPKKFNEEIRQFIRQLITNCQVW
jgi:pimeloyl-ACP methyl ester carboxylesterase